MSTKFDPQRHHRRSIRLQGYDYCVGGFVPPTRYVAGTKPASQQPGAHYVTIVTWHREFMFGEVVNGEMALNDVGQIVEWERKEIPKRLPFVALGAFIVMPNHFHGILIFHENVGATRHGLTRVPSGKKNFASHYARWHCRVAVTPRTSTRLPGRDHVAIQISRHKAVVENPILKGNPNLAAQLLGKCDSQRTGFAKQNRLHLSNPMLWDEDDNNPINVEP